MPFDYNFNIFSYIYKSLAIATNYSVNLLVQNKVRAIGGGKSFQLIFNAKS